MIITYCIEACKWDVTNGTQEHIGVVTGKRESFCFVNDLQPGSIPVVATLEAGPGVGTGVVEGYSFILQWV